MTRCFLAEDHRTGVMRFATAVRSAIDRLVTPLTEITTPSPVVMATEYPQQSGLGLPDERLEVGAARREPCRHHTLTTPQLTRSVASIVGKSQGAIASLGPTRLCRIDRGDRAHQRTRARFRWVGRRKDDDMEQVTSRDGTTIAFDRIGQGPPVVLVTGSLSDRADKTPLADQLAADFTVLNYDRRGRGPSGDTQPYAVEREIEDIEAVIKAAGGEAGLYGSSGGAALSLLAASAGLPVTKLALWEPPYLPEGMPTPPPDHVEQLDTMVAEGRRGDAVEYFLSKVVGMPPEAIGGMRQDPSWAKAEALAHTPAYDARILGDYRIPADRAKNLTVPTLVMAGGDGMPFMRDTAEALAEILPEGEARLLDGQGHYVDATVLAPVLKAFFAN
jgi:pimeloyl-ACP methyl ester carboxylesterase